MEQAGLDPPPQHQSTEEAQESPVVLHRMPGGRWFEHRGVRYEVTQGGPGWGYSVHGPSGAVVADGYFTLAEVREQVRDDLDAGEPVSSQPGGPR